ncbi:MAG: hypothetical protein IJO81_03445 [Clostridia bacterium]|nr:hypothetical protein [Clostridia bacterium]
MKTKSTSKRDAFVVYQGAGQTGCCPVVHRPYRNQFDACILSKLDKQQRGFRRSPFVIYKGANQTPQAAIDPFDSACHFILKNKKSLIEMSDFSFFQGANQNRTDE